MFGILLPPDNSVYSVKDVQVYKPFDEKTQRVSDFSLTKITDAFEELNNRI